MAHKDQNPAHKNSVQSPQPRTSSPTAVITMACLAVVAASYFGFVRPAQQHMQSLERQCNKLVVAVKKLQCKDDTARHGLRLLNLLDAQSEKITAAEKALSQFTTFREHLMQEAEAMAQASTALQQLENVRTEIEGYGQTLASTTTTLSEMTDVAAAISVSRDTAREANRSLATLNKLQAGLSGGMSQLNQQLSALETQIDTRIQNLPQAEASLTQIDQLCEQLASETSTLSTAQAQLRQLVDLKQEVLEHATDLPAAEAALDQIWDLHEGVLQAKSTIAKAQQLAVDMMLLEPVLDRVAKSLQPISENTRLSRRAEAKSPKTRRTASTVQSTSSWSNAFEVFVALLNPAE